MTSFPDLQVGMTGIRVVPHPPLTGGVGLETEIFDAITGKVTCSTTGFEGGDDSHHAVSIHLCGAGDWVRLSQDPDRDFDAGFTIDIRGDAELRMLMKAFRFLADGLEYAAGQAVKK